jgi:hypothetical protein
MVRLKWATQKQIPAIGRGEIGRGREALACGIKGEWVLFSERVDSVWLDVERPEEYGGLVAAAAAARGRSVARSGQSIFRFGFCSGWGREEETW